VHFTSSVYDYRIDILNRNLGQTKLTKHFGAIAGQVKLDSQFLKKKKRARKFQGRKN